jgi:hypothetical protein
MAKHPNKTKLQDFAGTDVVRSESPPIGQEELVSAELEEAVLSLFH